MLPDKFLDLIPLRGVLLGTILLALLAVELGFRLGRAWQQRTHVEPEPALSGASASDEQVPIPSSPTLYAA
jgi:hypothetical protein